MFSRLASAKVHTFLITKKPFPYFSYKKVDFYQKKAGYTILYNSPLVESVRDYDKNNHYCPVKVDK